MQLSGMVQMLATEKPFLVFGKPDITEREEEAVLKVLRSGWLGNGPVSKELEAAFASHLSRQDNLKAVAVNSCTMGLFLCLKEAGITVGDEVITTPLTFAATVNAILMTGATPVFADVDESGCIDPVEVAVKTTKKTKAVIPVHLAGVPCDMDGIMAFALERGLTVIEDAAHGFGGWYQGHPLGTIGNYGVFSFYPTKNLASGDGGMIVTRIPGAEGVMRLMASQGVSASSWDRYGSDPVKDYQVTMVGFKGLMTDVHAAIALTQLKRWTEIKRKRDAVWDIYEDAFGKKETGHSRHLFTIQSDNRDGLRDALKTQAIGTGVHYRPLHLEPGYSFLGYKPLDFPMAERIGERTLSLPVSPTMTKEDAVRVVQAVKKLKGEDHGI
jgi:dTDP-4-amino-4,6-dideoxygalactose transaminase